MDQWYQIVAGAVSGGAALKLAEVVFGFFSKRGDRQLTREKQLADENERLRAEVNRAESESSAYRERYFLAVQENAEDRAERAKLSALVDLLREEVAILRLSNGSLKDEMHELCASNEQLKHEVQELRAQLHRGETRDS